MTSILKADTIQDTDGNNIINESGNTITIGASGDTTNIIGTLQNNGAAVGGTMTPAFEANIGSNLTPSNDVNTLIVFDTERYDTDNAYDTSTGKFQPQTAGKYFLYGSIAGQSDVNNGNLFKSAAMIYFNGSETRVEDLIGENNSDTVFTRMSAGVSGVFTFNGSSDYAQIYANIQRRTGGDILIQSNVIRTYFGAYKIIT